MGNEALEQNNKQELLEFHEVEVKFRVDESKLNDWKQIVTQYIENNPDEYQDFIYVDSDDIYYITPSNDENVEYQFIRYRFSDWSKKDKRAELTTKKKLKNNDNIMRKEWNVRVDYNDKDTIEGFVVGGLGYERNFRISKYVQIYKFKDATLPFYTVIDENGKRDTFAEIEVDEKLLHGINKDQAWDIIRKYEEILAPLGITPQMRLRLSLFEMYRKKNERN